MERYKDLQDVRYQNGRLSQQQMADKIGISLPTYNLIENGKRHGSNRTWNTIQQLFDLTDAEVWRMQNQKN